MGLPMFREPDEVIAQEAAAKLDRAAAASRSAIRREPSIRPRRSIGSIHGPRRLSPRDLNRAPRSGRDLPSLSGFSTAEELDANRQIEELEAELERLRAIRLRHRTRLDREDAESRHQRVDPNDSVLLQDAMEYLRSRPAYHDGDEEAPSTGSGLVRQTVSQHLPRPPRESNLRFEVGVASRSSSPRRSQWRATPPWEQNPVMVDVRDSWTREGPQDAAPSDLVRRPDPVNIDVDSAASLETPPPETWEASYPPLRRVGHISPRPVGSLRVDGLGDRRRSPSPSSENQEEETWANLLTTMGSNRTSTASSFISNRSESATRSRSSQNTTTSFGEIGATDDSCDLDLPSGITEEDVRHIRDQHRLLTRREPDGPLIDGDSGSREHPERRRRRLDLGMFQNILERMQRREDVPDEWWAAVGLTPDVVRNN